ncbi:hypothetical protein KAU11_05585 [Candidatus Babeliales bacterium]|nr:hypothetical protein [Candidatus Babeliales bacterium]
MMLDTKKIAIVALIISSLHFSSVTSKTIKHPENRTKASLKEELGGEIKNILDQCVTLNSHLAQLQLEVAQLQKRLLSKGEELMDNGPSFKQAGRKPLANSIQTTETARHTLASLGTILNKGTVKSIIRKIDCDMCLKTASQS